MEDPSRISITICGDGGCGKSSITLRLVRSQWTSEYDPTIEDSYSITRRIDGQTYHLSLTDTAGQEEYRGMWGGQNLRADAFLMVYDITNADSLDQLEYFNDLVDMEADTRYDAAAAAASSYAGIRNRGRGGRAGASTAGMVMPVKIVAGNKCDLQESRQVEARTGLEWARRRNCGFMETSARNVVNIEETFALIVRRVVERRKRAAQELAGVDGDAARAGDDANPRNPQSLRLPLQGLDGDVDAMGSRREPRLGTRRAVTAPLSPLPVDGEGNEKSMGLGRGLRGPRGRPRGGGARFWGKLRCW